MTDLSTPSATRLRAPTWRDSRLLVGVLLVLLSTVLGSVVIARADDRVPVYAAARVLTPGAPVAEGDLVRVDVALGSARAAYLSARAPVPAGARVLRVIRPGELLPRSAVGSAAQVRVQPVALAVDAVSAARLVTGSSVDVYVNLPKKDTAGGTAFAGPVRMLTSVDVIALGTVEAVVGASDTTSIEVLVPVERVEDVVAAVDDGAKITVVPVPGSLLGATS